MPSSSLEEQSTAPVRSIVEYPLPRGKLLLALQGDPPGWVEPTLKTLGQMLALPRNWDSYGGRPIDPGAVWTAWQLLLDLLVEDSPTPAVVPTARGGVQIEWHRRGIDLEVEVLGPRQFHVSFEDAGTGEAWEKELTGEIGELTACIHKLSERKEPIAS